ncbi:MAG: hypothetical protein C0505_15660, partial [Leptothrix sp. (in: Bacteria)]|nr:hypothetical protein [Leptothrix sp. (in: b-proteobacteria)]
MQHLRTPGRLLIRVLLAALASTAFSATTGAIAARPASSSPKTICTVTINSSDEREVFQRRLPAGDYRFVELVRRGQPDWLADACKQGVRCDA